MRGSTVFRGLRAAELQAVAATTIQKYQEQIKQHEEKIMELRNLVADAASAYNSGAAINEKLPSEILLEILRYVTPTRKDHMAPIRITHVCRFWRTLVHRSPSFWIDILDPKEKSLFTARRARFPIVLTALEKSQPASSLSLSLHVIFLSTLATLPCHVSRISTLWLDCSYAGHGKDIRDYPDLHIPQLERLTLWRARCFRTSTVAPDASSVRFPRLTYLRTNCSKFALETATPAMRTLILGSRPRDYEEGAVIPRSLCCGFEVIDDLLEALTRFPTLEELEIHYCLPDRLAGSRIGTTANDVRLPSVRMHSLKVLHLGEPVEVSRAVLERLEIRDTAKITLCTRPRRTDDRYHGLSDIVTAPGVLAIVAQIRSLAIYVPCTRSLDHRFSIVGEDECGDRRLSLHSRDSAYQYSDIHSIDLLLFFKAATAHFPPTHITRLRVANYLPCRDEYCDLGWPWLFRRYSQVTDLALEVDDPTVVLAALVVSADVLVHLERLTITYRREGSAALCESMVLMLEQRSSRGTPLKSFSFTQAVDRREGGSVPVLTDDQVARLKAPVRECEI